MSEDKKQLVVGVAVISDRRILLLLKDRNGIPAWILPGGKPKDGTESEIDCLKREVAEELPNFIMGVGDFYSEFFGVAPHSGVQILVRVYFATFDGGDITPAAEISRARFFSRDQAERVPLSDVTRKILDQLKANGFIV